MFGNKSENEICYQLPEDGLIAKQKLLDIFNSENITSVYIKAFGFNMDDLLNSILVLDQKNIPVYILADYMQARSPGSWDKLVKFNSSLKNSQLILTTAGCGSDQPSIIFHTKSFSVLFSDKPALNWDGSCNFSDSGWSQANSIRVFESEVFSGEFIKHFNDHRNWALKNASHKQIDYILKNPVSAQELTENEETADFMFEINRLKIVIFYYKFSIIILLIMLLFLKYL